MGKRIYINAKNPLLTKQNSTPHKQKVGLPSQGSHIDRISFCQKTIGNQAVLRLIKSGILQAKLRIGQPGDKYEQEADRVAKEVMRMPAPQTEPRATFAMQETSSMYEEEKLRRQPIEVEQKKLIQTKEISGHNAETTPDLESRINAVRGGGRPLPESTRSFFEPHFSHHFKDVRVHTNAESDKLTKELGAKAFTSGKDIFFQNYTYQPSSKAGKELLAHELTHVVQQTGDQGMQALKVQPMETPTIQRWGGPEPRTIAGPEPAEEAEPMRTYEAVPLELGEPTNDFAALAPASLEMLFRLYTTINRRFRLMPEGVVFGRDWVMGTTGTAHLRGVIRWKLNRRLGQAGQREHLLRFVDGIQGTENRLEELRFMINRAFRRAVRQGVAQAQRTAPTLVDVGRENRGRTFGRRSRARAGGADLSHRIHAAMDISGPEGTGVYSPIDGQVLFAGQGSGYGNLVIILHESPPPTETAGADALTTNYAHLQDSLVSTGDRVRAGQAVGLMGATRSGSRVPPGMGVHLHFSVQRVPGGGLPERLRLGRLSSAYEERRDLRIHPGRWLNQLGVAIATIDVDVAGGPTELIVHRTAQPQPGFVEPVSPSPESGVRETLRRVVDRKLEARKSPVATVSQSPEPGMLQRYIPAGQLPQFGTTEQTAFMRRVYELQRQMAARQRTFVGDLPASQLAEIEGGVQAQRGAAAACRMLLHAAREALQEHQRRGDRLAGQVHSIGVASGYRSARRQLRNWRTFFPRYYRQTQEQRGRQPGGEHGASAALLLARYIRSRLAAPGYSLHNSGIAIDFNTRQGRHHLGPNTSQIAQWNRSWFFRWLTANAANFGFAQNPSINEPWHWELVCGVELIEFSEEEGELITGSVP